MKRDWLMVVVQLVILAILAALVVVSVIVLERSNDVWRIDLEPAPVTTEEQTA